MFQRSSTYIMSIKNGWDVLFAGLYCEGGPPSDTVDRLFASLPHHMSIGVGQRATRRIAELDKDLLDGLRSRGFQLNYGIHDTGPGGLLVWSKGGGYYFETGASQLIVDGKIKLKSGPQIEKFTEHAIQFDDGSELEADVVVFATGLGDRRAHIQRVCGDALFQKCKPIWGLNKEGEINGAWRDIGIRGLWYMIGNLALARFHSKHVALQIKAMEEGVFGERYSAAE
jgi:cation diffusion facilitator CzcD-associated flavoprotein CzcO